MTGPRAGSGSVEAAALPPVALLAVALGLPPDCSAHRPTDAVNALADDLEIEPAPESGWRSDLADPLCVTGSWP